MNTKQKTVVTALVSVLILAVIGLTIGLVIVASAAGLGSSMRVQYTAGAQVDCSITASAKNYATDADTTGTVINIKGATEYDQPSKTVEIDASLTDDQATANTIGNIEFKAVTLAAQGRAVYKFDFVNTAGAGAGDIKVELSAAIDTDDASYGEGGFIGNVTIGVGTDEATAKAATSTSVTVEDLSVGDAATTIYVVMTITDASVNADAIANVTINITPDTTNA